MDNIKAGDQLFVNNKWYFDVKSADGTNVKVRVKYYEGAKKDYYLYQVISIPAKLLTAVKKEGFLTICTIADRELKMLIGGLIDRLVKEPNILSIVEAPRAWARYPRPACQASQAWPEALAPATSGLSAEAPSCRRTSSGSR
jgi:hypothetical protein